MSTITIGDFYPAEPVTASDFYPPGRTFNADSYARQVINKQFCDGMFEVIGRMEAGKAASMEVMHMVKFCLMVLEADGIKFDLVRLP